VSEVNLTELQSVLITGASTGIGKACAHYLDGRGIRVFAGVRRQADGDRLEKEANQIEPVLIDVTDAESIENSVTTIEDSLGGEGLLGIVNNAGVVVGGPLELLPIDRLRMQLEVNLIGQVAVTQAFLPFLRRAQGRVVNMSSISGRIAAPMLGPYALSKFALEAFSDSLRRELHPWGIHVSVVEPGAIATPIWRKSIDRVDDVLAGMPEQTRQLYGEGIERAREAAIKMSEEAVPAVEVAEVVYHALTSPKPRTRYLVGKDAKIAARLAWLLPDRVMDWVMRRSRNPNR
jgi:NAD(P)-dependent dehydrogenase (short-subunit alcohol dehydrogenase family)